MADSASSTLPLGPPDEASTTSPARDARWRDLVTELLPETDINLNVCCHQTKEGYIDACLQQIIRAGTELVREAGGVANAGSQLTIIQLTKLTATRAFIESAQHLYPEIASEAMSIYANGEAPKY